MNAQSPVIAPKELKQLAALESWRTVAAIAQDWAVIALAIAAGIWSGNIFVYLLAVAVIAGRMHAFGVLLHEASHYRIFKNKKLNDWVGDIFLGWPLLSTVDNYRVNHLAHHQHTNTEKDPDWIAKIGNAAFTFPQKARQLFLHLAGYVVAVNSFRDLVQIMPRLSKNDRSSLRYKTIRFGAYLLLAGLFTVLGIWREVLLYWFVPFFTLFFLFLHIRSVAEHFGGMDYSDELGSTRTVHPYFWERWFLAPHNVNFHLEHHLYPGVPFYNLPKLHEALMENEGYRARAHLTRGYSTGLVRECLSQSA